MHIEPCKRQKKNATEQTDNFQADNFPLLAKRLFTEKTNDIILNFVPLRLALRNYVSEQHNTLGVYFEYLPSGVSIGANSQEESPLVSLSKVPLTMSIMKKIERGQMKLTDRLIVRKEDLDSRFGNLWKDGEGKSFTIDELIKKCLTDSDNTAYNVLFNALSKNEVNEVYDNLDINIDTDKQLQSVSPKSYSSIMRSLYLSSFLAPKNSSYLLDILTKTNFKDKIPAGVPEGIPIAHKVGVLSRSDTSQDVFSDCGIVYVPQRPYILCVFVNSLNEQEATKMITYVSNMVYQYIAIVRQETN